MTKDAEPAVEQAPLEELKPGEPVDYYADAEAFLNTLEGEDRTGGEAPFTGDEGTDLADEAEEKVADPEEDDDYEDEAKEGEDEEKLSKTQKTYRSKYNALLKRKQEQEQIFEKETAEVNELMARALEEINFLKAQNASFQELASQYNLDNPITPEQLRIDELQRQLAAEQRQKEYAEQLQAKSRQAAFMGQLEEAAQSANISLSELAGRLQARGWATPERAAQLTPQILAAEAAEFARLAGRAKKVDEHIAARQTAPKAISPKKGQVAGLSHDKQPGENDWVAAGVRFLNDLESGQ